MNLQRKIFIGMIALTLMSLATGALGIYLVGSLTGSLQHAATLTKLTQTQMHADMMHDALRGDALLAISSSDPAFNASIADVKADLEEHSTKFIQDFDDMAANRIDPALDAIIADTRLTVEQYVAAARGLVAVAAINPAGAKAGFGAFMEKFSALEERMEQVTAAIEERSNAATVAGHDMAEMAHWLTVGAMIASLIASLVTAAVILFQVMRPLSRITADVNAMAGGDKEITPSGLDRRDEIGLFARALAKFRQNEEEAISGERGLVQGAFGVALERLVQKDLTYRIKDSLPAAYEDLRQNFNHAMEELESVIGSVSASTNVISTGTREISSASNDLSHRTQSQAASLEETAAAVTSITDKVRQSSESANRTREVASVAQVEVNKSSAVVKRAIEAMAGIEKSSNQITQIIGVIDEIAFQTNLLALNAGVEAARAGENGKGFAVVAQEVRALAVRSADAAKEIKTLIASALTQVNLGVQLVDETGTSLEQITARIVEINKLMNVVAESAEEQASSLREINKAVGEMDRTTQANAAKVEQTSNATQGLVQQSVDLNEVIGTFVTNARNVLRKATHGSHGGGQEHVPAAEPPRRKAKAVGAEEGWAEF